MKMYDKGAGVNGQYCRVTGHVAHFPPQANQNNIKILKLYQGIIDIHKLHLFNVCILMNLDICI